MDWTWDNTEGFEGSVVRFNITCLGRKKLFMPICGHTHTYFNPREYLNFNDQLYQKRNVYIVKFTYKVFVNMQDIILYFDPEKNSSFRLGTIYTMRLLQK